MCRARVIAKLENPAKFCKNGAPAVYVLAVDNAPVPGVSKRVVCMDPRPDATTLVRQATEAGALAEPLFLTSLEAGQVRNLPQKFVAPVYVGKDGKPWFGAAIPDNAPPEDRQFHRTAVEGHSEFRLWLEFTL